jgi:hypothetical protein
VSILKNLGNATFAPQLTQPVGLGPTSLALGDLNGDDKLDIVVANSQDSTLSLCLNAGNGTCASLSTLNAGGTVAVALGDLNGDGKLDILAAGGNALKAFLNNGSSFAAPQISFFPVGHDVVELTLGDVDGDGKLDAITCTNGDRFVDVFPGLGSGAFAARLFSFVIRSTRDVSVGDLDNDGALDLAVTNDTVNTLTLIFSNP